MSNSATERLSGVLILGDALDLMQAFPEGFVDLIVTSPPYFNARDYSHWDTYEGYLEDMRRFLTGSYHVLKSGGRIAVNVCAGYNRAPWIPVSADLTKMMQSAGFLLRGQIVWDKGQQSSGRTAWGSWMSASNPHLRDCHEIIIVASKARFGKGSKGESDISRDEFLLWTQSVWRFRAESSRNPHPAPFPLELPRRLIKLYSYVGDLIMDPFAGSGTTLLAAHQLQRRWIGIELKLEFAKMAEERLRQAVRYKQLTLPEV